MRCKRNMFIYQKRSCQVWISVQKDRSGQSPWFLALDPQGWHEGRTFPLKQTTRKHTSNIRVCLYIVLLCWEIRCLKVYLRGWTFPVTNRHLMFPVLNKYDVPTRSFIVVNTDAVQLQVTVSMVAASGVNAMFITNHFPELRENKKQKPKNNCLTVWYCVIGPGRLVTLLSQI